ncbi:MAG: glycosyltransferase family 39 protein [Candidatus Sulfotelmatobacter sp.]
MLTSGEPERSDRFLTFIRRDPYVLAITVLTALTHLMVAGRYDIFRNELYFIVCGRHPAFGYVDQPPLVPLLAALTQVFGTHVWLLRLPAVIAATALVPLTADFARRLGGNSTSAVLAAASAALAPALIGMTTATTTATFEPIAWTLCAYALARAILDGEERVFLWAGFAAGFAMEAKYGIAIWLLGLAAGFLLTNVRAIFCRPRFWYGVFIGVAIAFPSLLWQTAHHWPFLELILNKHRAGANFTGTPLRFEIGQILAMNLVLLPLWVTGMIAPFISKRLAKTRFLSIAFIGATVLVFVTGGKDYYLFPVYPTMFAVGAAACSELPAWLLGGWFALATMQTLVLAPVVLPILNPPVLASYLASAHLKPPPDEAAAVGAPLTQVFSDELGWRDLEHHVAVVYRSLPPDEQRGAAIFATNYGEAAAIDVYGRADGLPPAISGQNQYYLWGPRGHDSSLMILVNVNPNRWREFCRDVDVVDTFGVPYAMPYESDRPISICRGLRLDLLTSWYRFKRYE